MNEGVSPGRVARWFETTARPGALLLVVVAALYAPSLGDGFMIDDHRALRVLEEYRAGQRSAPDVYRFLMGDVERNRAEREAGWYPWWMADELKYQHMRPLAEWMLYAEYRVFGARPIGYRLVSLGLYGLGVVLVLRLMRVVCAEERTARLAGLVFAVAASHAIPVMFVSSQGDVAALVCAVGGALAAEGFLRRGGAARLAGFLLFFSAGLGLKEAMLPVAAAPLLMWLLRRGDGAAGRRALAATALSAAVSGAWLALYVAGGYGSNTSIMLDPLRDPAGYLSAGPGRALALLAAWVAPLNPFLFECKTGFQAYERMYLAAGAVVLTPIAVMLWRRHRRARGAAAMALWTAMFLPILVCTPADDRVMMLPSVGLAYFAAVWIAHPAGARRYRRIPLLLFVGVQATTVLAAGRLLAFLERESQRHLAMMTADGGEHLYVVNNPFAFEGLFMMDRLRSMPEWRHARVSLLSDALAPTVSWRGERVLRLEAGDPPILSGFLGRMGAVRGRPRAAGDTQRGDGFTARIVEADARGVRAVEFVFDRPVRAGEMRFYTVDAHASPHRIEPE
ncbi:MAG: hypothetical protein DCC65_14680 [Planctomycetota bacterium]|nr:MAG: hypothetical protein DCC65_14680 [Planctomycetota bacterium]